MTSVFPAGFWPGVPRFYFARGFLSADVGSVRLSLETGIAIFKQLFLPLEETDRMDAVFVTEVRYRHLFEQVLPENRYVELNRSA